MLRGIRVQALPPSVIEARAERVRRELAPDVDVDCKVDMMQAIEAWDGRVIEMHPTRRAVTKFAVEKLPNHVLGATNLFDDRLFLTLNATTYTLMGHDEGYARFTAAHEIGHSELHRPILVRLKSIPHQQAALLRANPKHEPNEDSEVQANTFAAAFLAPNRGLEMLADAGWLTVREVMNVFGLGRKSAIHRIDNFNRWRAAQKRSSGCGGR